MLPWLLCDHRLKHHIHLQDFVSFPTKPKRLESQGCNGGILGHNFISFNPECSAWISLFQPPQPDSYDRTINTYFYRVCVVLYLYFIFQFKVRNQLCRLNFFPLSKLQGLVKRETRFTSKSPANEIMSKIEETAKPLGFNVHKRNYKVVYSSCALHLDMLLIVTLVCLLELAKEIKI